MKFVLAAVLLLIIVVTPVLGKNEDKSSNGQGQGNSQGQGNNDSGKENKDNSNNGQGSEKKEEKQEKAQSSASPSTTKKLNTARVSNATGSGQTCDPNYPWKNHGEYVSCVAKSGAGGKAVSEAARSDIGKKNSTPSASLSPSPDASSSASPSATIEPSPEATSSGLINSITESIETVQEKILSIGDQFTALLELLNPFD